VGNQHSDNQRYDNQRYDNQRRDTPGLADVFGRVVGDPAD
jgi:hypothetical protein